MTSSAVDAVSNIETCLLCGKKIDEGKIYTVKTEKGLRGLQRASQKRGEAERAALFFVGQKLHTVCRHDYANAFVIKRDLAQRNKNTIVKQHVMLSPIKLRSTVDKPFCYKTDCILCGHTILKNEATFAVHTLSCERTLLHVCTERSDKWARDVRCRIEAVIDLPAAEAQYHQQCSSNFRTKRSIPKKRKTHTEAEVPSKKLKSIEKFEAFLAVANYFQNNDDEQTSLTELKTKMQEILLRNGSKIKAYSEKHLKEKLLKHFKDEIIVTNIKGKTNVVTFRTSVEQILYQFSKEDEESAEEKKIHIIKTAAKLILADLKMVDTNKQQYPSSCNVANLEANLNFVPFSLRAFLTTLIGNKNNSDTKVAAIGQAITQAARPKVLLAPMQFGLGVELHHLFASKYLIEHLYRLGFTCSYDEVKLFEQNAAIEQGTEIDGIMEGSCVQFIADNVDHNMCTLDGMGTFHGMGIIAAVTPSIKSSKTVHRNKSISARHVQEAAKIPMKLWSSTDSQRQMAYTVLPDINNGTNHHHDFLDMVHSLSWPLRSPRPGWSGTMQTINSGHHPGQTQVTFLPMIDMNPADMSCIFTTLHFISRLSDQHHVTPILTFDQPLWWKAKLIIASEPQDSPLHSIVLRLGGFHTEMSFLGCIGNLMSGSGLEQVIEVIYATNTVAHILTGKALNRAVRAHFIIYDVLSFMLASRALNLPLEEDAKGYDSFSTHGNDDLQVALTIFDKLLAGNIAHDQLYKCKELSTLRNVLIQNKNEVCSNPTSRLWQQYMDMVEILRHFLRAERTGNWLQHLQALKDMLPYLAASGHNLYTKSLSLYLQDMCQLESNHPTVYHDFMNGHHVLRRSDRYWAGLSTDLVIEQVLLRSVKSTGGLTRGRGMNEAQRCQWLLSMPACADISNAMQDITGIEFTTSDQHKESTESRQVRDDQDMRKLLKFLIPRNPFSNHLSHSLQNICTGVTADPSTNVERAKMIGLSILNEMAGKNVSDFKFKKINQAVTMNTKHCFTVDGKRQHVNPYLLFQRILAAAKCENEDGDISGIFQYELAIPPASLFEPSGLLRQSNKSKLADLLPQQQMESDAINAQYILDGGSLLHRIPWKKDDSFAQICESYRQYTERHFPNAVIVFDGYSSEPSTKDQAHLRRTFGIFGPLVQNFNAEKNLSSNKDTFLSNICNKQSFVQLLSNVLERGGFRVLQSHGDADTLIVQTALRCSTDTTTCVVGEDTDLLVLLCHHIPNSSKPVYFKTFKSCTVHNPATLKKQWHIQHLQKHLKPEVCQLLPFLHAINGCDTTSRIFGTSKGAPLKKAQAGDKELINAAKIFCMKQQKQDAIVHAGESALVSLLNGSPGMNLDKLRFQRFCAKAANSNTPVQIQTLPPTSSAAKYHSLRVYLQVQIWNNLNQSEELDPLLWGWKKENNFLQPITTDNPPAPPTLLKMIKCQCKTGCTSKRCSCRKLGLPCSMSCGDCKGLSCANSTPCIVTDMSDLI